MLILDSKAFSHIYLISALIGMTGEGTGPAQVSHLILSPENFPHSHISAVLLLFEEPVPHAVEA